MTPENQKELVRRLVRRGLKAAEAVDNLHEFVGKTVPRMIKIIDVLATSNRLQGEDDDAPDPADYRVELTPKGKLALNGEQMLEDLSESRAALGLDAFESDDEDEDEDLPPDIMAAINEFLDGNRLVVPVHGDGDPIEDEPDDGEPEDHDTLTPDEMGTVDLVIAAERFLGMWNPDHLRDKTLGRYGKLKGAIAHSKRLLEIEDDDTIDPFFGKGPDGAG